MWTNRNISLIRVLNFLSLTYKKIEFLNWTVNISVLWSRNVSPIAIAEKLTWNTARRLIRLIIHLEQVRNGVNQRKAREKKWKKRKERNVYFLLSQPPPLFAVGQWTHPWFLFSYSSRSTMSIKKKMKGLWTDYNAPSWPLP